MHSVGTLTFLFFCFLTSEVLKPHSAWAQLVADGATNILDGVSTNVPSTITVGTNGSFTLLILTNNATLSNASTTFIGLNASAKSNAIVVTGPGSAWSINAAFIVGVSGGFNQLSVLDGGIVSVTGGTIGENSS